MKTQIHGVEVWQPSRQEIQQLAVGGAALDCFGRWNEVVEITARGIDVHGKLFTCYYTRTGPTSRVSGSAKEGEIVPTIPLTARFKRTSAVQAILEERRLADNAAWCKAVARLPELSGQIFGRVDLNSEVKEHTAEEDILQQD